jgi:hypothetical protein
MKHFLFLTVLSLLVITSVIAQEDPAAQRAAVEVSEEAATDHTSQDSPLAVLDWMVGTWIDEGEDATIVTTCEWTKNRKFLKRSFQVKVDEDVTLEGDQFVGWDPLAGQIRSWTFDSEGGFGEGLWIQDGDQWLVKASFVLADGARASSLNVHTHVDENTIRWQSTNREIAGELQPNIPEVTVVRQQSRKSEKEESQ